MSRPATRIRLGTRSSPLALAQAELVVRALAVAQPEVEMELVPMRTAGDLDPRPFADIGARGIFASELERALLAGEIDLAVHSSKDLALEATPGLELAAWLPREDPRDVVCGSARSLDELPRGATVATSSARRAAALGRIRPDIVTTPIRGNVQTRLARAAERGDAGCMLAAAGLHRLGLEQHIGFSLDVEQVVPEAGQGAVVVQVRTGEARGGAVAWELLDHAPTAMAVRVERRVAAAMGGGCETPVGVHVDASRGRAAVFIPGPDGGGSASSVVTHAFTPSAGGVIDEDALVTALLEHVDRARATASSTSALEQPEVTR
jgi:hydroxymethylbilane synthase